MKRLLDKIDERIIDELAGNSRLAHNDIAMKVNLSRNAVRLRIERLERDGYIKGYTIVRGDPAHNDTSISALIFVYRQDRMRGAEVVRKITSMREVVSCHVMSGDLDIVLRIEASTPDKIHKVWNDISALPGVVNTVTSFVLSVIK